MQQEFRKSRLTGLQIAVVEDEFLIARDICETLSALGAEVIGPFPTVTRALAGLADHEPMAVLLDLNLVGQSSLPVAQYLAQRHIPFLILTGYGANMITDDVLRAAPMVPKPFDEENLISRLLGLLSSTSHGRY